MQLQPLETKEKKNLIYILIFLCILCIRATDLQGVWGEPHQMPDLSTADTVKAEAIFRMKWLMLKQRPCGKKKQEHSLLAVKMYRTSNEHVTSNESRSSPLHLEFA